MRSGTPPPAELTGREFEVWNGGDVATIDDLYAADGVYHDGFGEVRDRASLKEYVAATRETFPDFAVREEGVVADESTSVARYTISGTMEGSFHGFEPTGESFEIHGFVSHRVEAGEIVEAWNAVNAMAMAEQLGLL
jgi:steroid delta-isomerase-like uncharacterized protein